MGQKVTIEGFVSRGAPQFSSRPQDLVAALVVAIFTGTDSRWVLENHVGMLFKPIPCGPRSFEILYCKRRIVGLIDARRDGSHGRQITSGAGALERGGSGSNYSAGQLIILRHHEA